MRANPLDAGPPDPGDPPCDVCGGDPGDCLCPECPVCGETGNPACYREHGLVETAAQRDGRERSAAFEWFYDQISRRTGQSSTHHARQSARHFWLIAGGLGAEWVVKRLANETNGDVMEGVTNILADIGLPSLPAIVASLNASPSDEHARELLRAVKYIRVERGLPDEFRVALEPVLARYRRHGDEDLREAAAVDPFIGGP